MICRNCNSEIPENAKFCPICATEVVREPVLIGCPYCNSRVNENNTFCPQCGNRLVKAEKKVNIETNTPSTANNFGASYAVSAITSVICFFIRCFTQVKLRVETVFSNSYFYGIEPGLTTFLVFIPAIASVIVSLIIVSDYNSTTQEKVRAFIINFIFIALACLFIYFKIPTDSSGYWY